jgi:hypothetical protein
MSIELTIILIINSNITDVHSLTKLTETATLTIIPTTTGFNRFTVPLPIVTIAQLPGNRVNEFFV